MKKYGRAFTAAPAPTATMLECGWPSNRRSLIAGMFITVLTCSLVAAPSAMAQSRGELLYTTHCNSCHTTEMHWRDKRAANNWPALKALVRHWQDAASLAWSEADILDVSRYLNEATYHFEQTADPVSSISWGTNEPDAKLINLDLIRRP
jgi:mono/diheme cytochrome c family protein